jgi:hypothetical protein
MNKILSLISVLLVSASGLVQAAFTPLADGDYRMTVTSGCFAFGDCSDGFGAFEDNGETVTSTAGTFGTGIAGDGVMGVIDFNLTGGVFTVTSFSQDSYLRTPGGTVAIGANSVGAMGGTIDGSGNMELDPTGRLAIAQFFADSIGLQPWNIDDAPDIGAVTGLYEPWTTGISTNKDPAGIDLVNTTLVGTPLQDAGAGVWVGTLVSAGNVGTAWGPFVKTPYTEIFDITITQPGPPVPGAVVDVSVENELQECTEYGGSQVTFTADVELLNGGELSTLTWELDGQVISVGSEFSLTTFVPLGSHTMTVTATLVTGHVATDTVALVVQDTQAPDLSVGFVDVRSGELVTEIAGSETRFVEVRMLAEDICDPAPVVDGNVIPVFAVENGDVIRVQGNKGQIDLPTTALSLSATATDASGNTTHASTTLEVIAGP